MFFYLHFRSVRARYLSGYLKFDDTLYNVKIYLLNLFFLSKRSFLRPQGSGKRGQKGPLSFIEPFFPFKLQEYCLNIFLKLEKFQKCPNDQVYLSPGS